MLSCGVEEDKREFIYRVDPEDSIVFANANWYDFACENGEAALIPGVVVGSPLWSFICNSETRHLYEILLKKIRNTGRSVKVPYRCDSPDCRRFMELRIARLANQEVEFRSRILRLELRVPVRLLEGNVERTEELLIMCSWCKKVAVPDKGWVEVEEAVNVLRLFDKPRLPRISHGICDPCSVSFFQLLEQDFPEVSPL